MGSVTFVGEINYDGKGNSTNPFYGTGDVDHNHIWLQLGSRFDHSAAVIHGAHHVIVGFEQFLAKISTRE